MVIVLIGLVKSLGRRQNGRILAPHKGRHKKTADFLHSFIYIGPSRTA